MHGDGRRTFGGGVVAELAGVVLSPAIGEAVGREPAGVGATGRDETEGETARYGGGSRHGRVVEARAELVATVGPPAPGGAGGRHRTGMAAARADLREDATAHDGGRSVPVAAGAVAELAELILAPAGGRAGERDRTSVIHCRRNGPQPTLGQDGDRDVPGSVGAVADLAGRVQAPTVGGPLLQRT